MNETTTPTNQDEPPKPDAKPLSLERMVRRIPVMLLCFVAHITGFLVAITIGKDFWLFMLCAMTGLACIVIGMHRDDPPNSEIRRVADNPAPPNL